VAAAGHDSDTSEVDGLKREEALGAEPPPASADARPAATDTAQDSRPAETTGTLQVRASPFAILSINGRKMGEVTGRATYKLAPGTYKLVFQHPAGSKQFDVTVTAGTTVVREFRAPKAR
jgi:serine/threonine-protein kinase